MENNLEKKKDGLMPSEVRNFINGENGVQVGHADTFSPTFNIYLSGTPDGASILNSEYYNLLIGYDPANTNRVIVTRDRALKEYMAEEVKPLFWPIGEHIDNIRKFPAIIIEERDRPRIDEQQGVIALIQKIRFQQNGIVVYFQKLCDLPMRILQDHLFDFGLETEWELNRTHWTIKNINLSEALEDSGFTPPEEING